MRVLYLNVRAKIASSKQKKEHKQLNKWCPSVRSLVSERSSIVCNQSCVAGMWKGISW